MVTLTESAVKEIQRLSQEMATEGQGLRLFVEGSCCGTSYGMGFDNVKEDDHVLDQHGLKVLVAPHAAEALKGVVIDCIQTPEGPAFEILSQNDPMSQSGGGCCGGRGSEPTGESTSCCRS